MIVTWLISFQLNLCNAGIIPLGSVKCLIYLHTLLQELQVEKQKTNRVESMMREQRAAMEKELGSMQVKAQGTYQELQTMQIKVKPYISTIFSTASTGLYYTW